MKTKNLENFQKLVSNEQSGWLDKFLYYKANKSWLDKSAMVAVNVLEVLKAKGWSQKDLAEKMKVSSQQVNKILKGQQNLTLETISKLETTLEISLIEIIDFKTSDRIIDISNSEKRVAFALMQMEKAIPVVKKQVAVYEKNIALGKNQKKPIAPQFKKA
jgi:transcriptional regulator with XRE-family HTH domain